MTKKFVTALDSQRRLMLERAARSGKAQINNQPPYDPSWSFFDLSEIYLYLGDTDKFLKVLDEGIRECSHTWQLETEIA